MAKQTINIGTVANDGTGDPLRSAFDKANDNFTELYGAGALSIASDILTYTKADGTTSTVDLTPYLDEDARSIASGTLNGATGIVTFTRDDASTFTLDLSALLDDTNIITSVNSQTGAVVLDSDDIAEGSTNLYDQTVTLTASTGMSITGTYPNFTIASVIEGNATHTGDVTGSTALSISADVVDHDELAPRYTAIQDIATTSGTITLNASTYAAFNLTGTLGTVTLDVQNIKTGQVIDIILSGSLSSAVITLSASTFTTVAINKVGSTSLDTAATNIIQVLCVDDTDADAILTWAVASYASGTTV